MCEQIKIIEGDIKSDGMAILPGEAVSFFNIPLPDLPAAKLVVLRKYRTGGILPRFATINGWWRREVRPLPRVKF